jgi:hypothetical protein
MDVRMVRQRLSPAVQHHRGANLGAEVLWIGGDRLQRLGGSLEQQRIDDRLVLERDCGDRRRQREYDVEIRNRQQVGGTRFEPRARRAGLALRAMPIAAGVVGNGRVAAIVAALNVAAKRSCPARLNRSHHAKCGSVEVAGIAGAKAVAVAAEHVRHLQHRARHGRRYGAGEPFISSRSSGLRVAAIRCVETFV